MKLISIRTGLTKIIKLEDYTIEELHKIKNFYTKHKYYIVEEL